MNIATFLRATFIGQRRSSSGTTIRQKRVLSIRKCSFEIPGFETVVWNRHQSQLVAVLHQIGPVNQYLAQLTSEPVMNNKATRSVFIGLLAAVIIIVVFFITNYYHIVSVDHLHFNAFLTKYESSEEMTYSHIPSKIIHQSWKTTKLPKRFQKWSQTWKTCFPTWKYRLWNDSENRDFVAKYYPWFLKSYDGFKWHIHRVDSIRYLYLFHYGGIYSDLDNECLRPFEHLLFNYSLVFGAMTGQYASYIKEGYVQNSFMYSRPRHPFWLEMLHEVINRMKNSSPPEAIAGPITLVHCINMYRKRFTDDIKIYAPQYFNPNSWLKTRAPGCKDFNAMTEVEEKMCKKFYNSSYVIQYHTQTWGRGKVTRRVRMLL